MEEFLRGADYTLKEPEYDEGTKTSKQWIAAPMNGHTTVVRSVVERDGKLITTDVDVIFVMPQPDGSYFGWIIHKGNIIRNVDLGDGTGGIVQKVYHEVVTNGGNVSWEKGEAFKLLANENKEDTTGGK